MRYLTLAMFLMLAACDSGSSYPPQLQQDDETQSPVPTPPSQEDESEQSDPPTVTDDPASQIAQRTNDARDILDGRFLINSADDYWACNYGEGQETYWDAEVTFYEFGKGDILFDSRDETTTFAWSIGITLNMFGQGLGLTTFNVRIDTDPTSETGVHIGQLDADVAQGGQLECSKFLRTDQNLTAKKSD